MIKITQLDDGKANVLDGSRFELEFYVASVYLPYKEYAQIMEDLTDFPVKEDSFRTYRKLCEKIALEIEKEMGIFYDSNWFDFDYLSEVGRGCNKRLRVEIMPA